MPSSSSAVQLLPGVSITTLVLAAAPGGESPAPKPLVTVTISAVLPEATSMMTLSTSNPDELEHWANNFLAAAGAIRKLGA